MGYFIMKTTSIEKMARFWHSLKKKLQNKHKKRALLNINNNLTK